MVGRSALWRGVWGSIRALSLAAMCGAAIAIANAQEPGLEVDQPAPENAQPAAASEKKGSQTNTEPSPSNQQGPQPTPATGEAAQAAPVVVDPIIVLVNHRLTERTRGDGSGSGRS